MQELGRSNWRLKRLRKWVRDRRPGVVVVDGKRIVRDLAKASFKITELYISKTAAGIDEELVEELSRCADQTFLLADTVLASLAPTKSPQGFIAVFEEPEPPQKTLRHVGVFLDGLQDPRNVGAVIRSAVAFKAEMLLTSPGTADPFHPLSVRSSAGAVFHLPPHKQGEAAIQTLSEMASNGVTVVAASSHSGEPLEAWSPEFPLMLVLGSEGQGISADVERLCSVAVKISHSPEVESLNVAVASGIILWRLWQKRQNAKA